MLERIINIATLYGKSVGWYFSDPNRQYRNSKLELYDRAAEALTRRSEFAEFLVSNLGDSPGSVLEMAAGSGLVSSVLRERLENVTFLDLSLPALKVLQTRMPVQKGFANIINSDFLSHPFSSKCFDTIICVGGYRYVPPEQKRSFWTETLRIMRDNGSLFFAQFKPRGFPINGTTLTDNLNDYGLRVEREFRFNPRVDFGRIAVVTGSYEVVQYKKRSA